MFKEVRHIGALKIPAASTKGGCYRSTEVSIVIFTTRKRPAHPAWITRQVGEADGEVNVRQIGDFAGAEEPFAALITAPRKLRP